MVRSVVVPIEPQILVLQAAPFLGTWVFTMTDPPHFKGSMQTVKVWDEGGRIAASIQLGKFPPNNVTGIYRDSDMLVLTIGREASSPMRENGVALRAVIMLTPDGDGMRMALMLDESETIGRRADARTSRAVLRAAEALLDGGLAAISRSWYSVTSFDLVQALTQDPSP